MKAIDTPFAAAAAVAAPTIAAWGVQAVGLYLFTHSEFKQPLTAAEKDRLADYSVKVFSIWENGFPTNGGYFSQDKGIEDAVNAANLAAEAGQPKGTAIFATADYDPTNRDFLNIAWYMIGFQNTLDKKGYTTGLYGSGALLRFIKSYCEQTRNIRTYLSLSTGFDGYHEYYDYADIVQAPGTPSKLVPHDLDFIRNPEGIVW